MRIFRKMKRRLGLLGAAAVLALAAGPSSACRLALALALDVSGSVDAAEYRMQMDGLAEALTDPDVAAALFAMPGVPVAVSVFEWSASGYQRLIQDWVLLDGPPALDALAARLRGWTREAAPQATGLGAALRHGRGLIGRAPDCWQTTLDVSGDGENNDWPAPEDLRAAGALGDMRINGLVIAPDETGEAAGSEKTAEKLAAYFRARVIQGPDAFVEVAEGFSDYARAMRRKLLREIQTMPMGALDTDAGPDAGPVAGPQAAAVRRLRQ